MTANAITDLDHAGIGVRDLAAAVTAYARLGFHLTRRAKLFIPGPEAGTWAHSGADNHVAMFASSYLELVSITDPSRGNKFAARLEQYEGLHIVALGAPSAADAWRAVRDCGVDATPPEVWAREVYVDDRAVTARFRFFPFPAAAAGESVMIAVEHLTPELLRAPDLLQHPNGATELLDVVFGVPDADEAAARYARVLGRAAVREGDACVVALDRGRLLFAGGDSSWARAAGWGAEQGARPIALVFAVADAGATRAYFDGAGVRARSGLGQQGKTADRDVAVGPADACGCLLVFRSE